jgi:predicted nucleic-acid-binding protein
VRAVDTNVLARFFIDDPDDAESVRQRPAAARIMANPAWVSVTVLLELEWVMRGFYELHARDVVRVMRALCGLAHVTIEDRDHVLTAIGWHEGGVDFADAIHLARSVRCEALVTFDRTLVRRSRRAKTHPRAELLV